LLRFLSAVEARALTFVYVSSDAVFSGARGGYVESDAPDAATLYGRHLRRFEGEVKRRIRDHLIVRVSYLFGRTASHDDRRLEEAQRIIGSGRPFPRYVNVYKSPLPVADAARETLSLVSRGVRGVVHLPGPRMSIHAFYVDLLARHGLQGSDVVATVAAPEDVDGFDTSLRTDLPSS
jgi:dTDP-4-dehydrorhamnose reductase